MTQPKLRSVSVLLVVSILAALPGISHIHNPEQICTEEGCKWVEASCLCERDVQDLANQARLRSEKAFREELKLNPTYKSFVFGAVMNTFLGILLLLNDQDRKLFTARHWSMAMFWGLGGYFFLKAAEIRSL